MPHGAARVWPGKRAVGTRPNQVADPPAANRPVAHPLQQKVKLLRRRLRRVLFCYGLNRLLAALVATIVVLGLIDYLIQFRDPGLRVICWLVLLGVAGWTAWRGLYWPLAQPMSDEELAIHVQRHFGIPADALASALEFLGQRADDPLAGSAALRRLVIAETTGQTEPLRFSEAIDPRPAWRAATWGAAACLLAAILVVLDPVSSRIAVARLLNPLSGTAWPQQTHLKLRQVVTRVARGQAFEVEVVDAEGKPLPREVFIHYRFPSAQGEAGAQKEAMKFVGGLMVARRENVTAPFAYRVSGGDDDSLPWIDVEVVEPPRLSALGAHLVPPAYTGFSAQTIEPRTGETCALVGTSVELTGQASKPLQEAWLCLDGGRRIAAKLSADGRALRVPAEGQAPVVIERSVACWFELVDREGLRGGQDHRWQLRAIEDHAPVVVLERPSEDLFVTPQAVVPLRAVVKDDLAVARIELLFQPPGSLPPGEQPLEKASAQVFQPAAGQASPPAGEQPSEPASAQAPQAEPPASSPVRVLLYRGPDQPPAPPAEIARHWTARTSWPGVQQPVDYRWDLAALELAPGSQMEFQVCAADYSPQEGRSPPRRLMIITPEELQDRMAARQARLLALLDRAVEAQRTVRTEVASLAIRLEETARLDAAELDRLQAAALNQRQVHRSLTDPGEGALVEIRALLADLDNNRIDSPDIRRYMEQLAQQLGHLDRGELTPAEQELTAAVKAAQIALEQASAAVPGALPRALAAARGHQDAVLEKLAALLEQLRQWDGFRRFHREVGHLLRAEQALAERTGALAQRTLAQELGDLTPAQRADLRIAAEEQLGLALRLEVLQQQMDQAQTELEAADPLAAQTVADALDAARQLAISAAMRACAADIQENRLARATGAQGEVIDQLRELLDILANRRQHELDRRLSKLRQAEAELAELHVRQLGLCHDIEQNRAQDPSPLRRDWLRRLGTQQDELRQQAERLARRLQGLMADRAAAAIAQAAAAMASGARAAAGGDVPGAARGAGEAEQALAQARRELAARLFAAQAELARAQLSRLEDALKQLYDQQQAALEETRRLEALRQQQGRLTRNQAISLSDLVRLEELLQNDTRRLAEGLAGPGAFHLALLQAADFLGLAIELLAAQQTGPQTQQWQQRALERFGMVLAALAPDEAQPPEGQSNTAGAEPGTPGGEPGAAGRLAELKLLRLLQQEINLRTLQLDAAVAQRGGTPSDDQRREYEHLSLAQAQLAELVMQLAQLRPPAEHSPGALPDAKIEGPGPDMLQEPAP